jgi:hypothetical protein
VTALLSSIALLISCGKSRDVTREAAGQPATRVASAGQKSADQLSAPPTATNEVKAEPASVPPDTFKDEGACPFEGCIYRKWRAEALTTIYAQPDALSPVVFSVQPGEWVTAITGFVLTSEPGVFELIQDVEFPQYRLPRGAKVYVYTAGGEASYKAWFDGRFFDFEDPGQDKARLVKEPKNTWWVHIRSSENRDGWTSEAMHFSNNDQLGEDLTPSAALVQ